MTAFARIRLACPALLLILSASSVLGSPRVTSRAWIPPVVPATGSDWALLFVRTDSATASVTLEPWYGSAPFKLWKFDERTFVALVPPSLLLENYGPEDVYRNIIGHLVPRDASGAIGGKWLLDVNVDDPEISTVGVVDIGKHVRCAPHVVNILQPVADYWQDWDTGFTEILQRYYEIFPDDYDFLNLTATLPTHFVNPDHTSVRNAVQGIGLELVDTQYASSTHPRLLGVNRIPIDVNFDLASSTALHETGHQWINHLGKLPALDSGGTHWPLSAPAHGVMGFNLPSGGQGLDFAYEMTPLTATTFLIDNTPPPGEYTPIDLFLMGLLSASEVSPFPVFDPPNQPYCGGCVVTGKYVSMGEILAVHGPRIPDVSSSPTSFSHATLVITRGSLLTDRQLAFFDHFAARGGAQMPLPSSIHGTPIVTKPFAVATGGLGTWTTDIDCSSLSSEPFDSFVAPGVPPVDECPLCPPKPCLSCPFLFPGLDWIVNTVLPPDSHVGRALRVQASRAGQAFVRGDLVESGLLLDAFIAEVQAQSGVALTRSAASVLSDLTRRGAAILRVPIRSQVTSASASP